MPDRKDTRARLAAARALAGRVVAFEQALAADKTPAPLVRELALEYLRMEWRREMDKYEEK